MYGGNLGQVHKKRPDCFVCGGVSGGDVFGGGGGKDCGGYTVHSTMYPRVDRGVCVLVVFKS